MAERMWEGVENVNRKNSIFKFMDPWVPPLGKNLWPIHLLAPTRKTTYLLKTSFIRIISQKCLGGSVG